MRGFLVVLVSFTFSFAMGDRGINGATAMTAAKPTSPQGSQCPPCLFQCIVNGVSVTTVTNPADQCTISVEGGSCRGTGSFTSFTITGAGRDEVRSIETMCSGDHYRQSTAGELQRNGGDDNSGDCLLPGRAN